MFAAFAEAVRSTTQPCSFLLIVPTLMIVLVARGRWQAVVAAVGAAVVGGWLLAANRFVLEGAWLRISAAMVALVVVALMVPTARRRWPAVSSVGVQAGAAAAVTLIASQWWRPCVGAELGTILTRSQHGVVGQMPTMAVYMLGTMMPIVLVALAVRVLEVGEHQLGVVGWISATIVGVIAVSLVLGRHDAVVVTLTRWTLG